MDFFRSAYASAKEQATKAAAEASKHANKAAAEARVLAEQAQAAAKQQAEDASKRLQELQSDFQKLDLASVKGSMKQALAGAGGSGGGCSPEELARYGLTEELVNHIKGFTYVTFSDFPEEQLVVTRGVGADAMSSVMKLGPWQQTHAMLLIQAIPAFNDLRYVLCPRKMPEERFWEVYFRLTAPYLPEESQQFELLSGGGTAAAVVAAAAGPRLPESNSMGAFTLAQEEESAGEEASRYEADPEEEEEEGWGGGSESEVDDGVSLPHPASPAGAKAEAEAGAHPGSPSPSRPAAGDSESLPNTPGPTATQDGSSAADTPGTAGHEDASDDDLDDDFDAYVEGMLGGAGDADAEEGDADDDDDDDFDEYMNELAKEAGGDAGDDDDISLGSDDLDLGELDGDEEDS